MTTIDTNRFGLTIYYEPLETGGGICSVLDEDYNTLASDIFGHSRAYSIQLARDERRRLTQELKANEVEPMEKINTPSHLILK